MASCQKLGIILENKVAYVRKYLKEKNALLRKCRNIPMIFDIKIDFEGQFDTFPLQLKKHLPWCRLIFGKKKDCIPPLKTEQPILP